MGVPVHASRRRCSSSFSLESACTYSVLSSTAFAASSVAPASSNAFFTVSRQSSWSRSLRPVPISCSGRVPFPARRLPRPGSRSRSVRSPLAPSTTRDAGAGVILRAYSPRFRHCRQCLIPPPEPIARRSYASRPSWGEARVPRTRGVRFARRRDLLASMIPRWYRQNPHALSPNWGTPQAGVGTRRRRIVPPPNGTTPDGPRNEAGPHCPPADAERAWAEGHRHRGGAIVAEAAGRYWEHDAGGHGSGPRPAPSAQSAARRRAVRGGIRGGPLDAGHAGPGLRRGPLVGGRADTGKPG